MLPVRTSRLLRLQTPILTTLTTTTLYRSFASSRITMAAQEYKLKGITSLNLAAGTKTEAEVEGIEGAKVLLVNANGTVQAMGAKCTHYGAPLVNGVMTNTGRLKCPWHGGEQVIPECDNCRTY